jgi:hypothetical protein
LLFVHYIEYGSSEPSTRECVSAYLLPIGANLRSRQVIQSRSFLKALQNEHVDPDRRNQNPSFYDAVEIDGGVDEVETIVDNH